MPSESREGSQSPDPTGASPKASRGRSVLIIGLLILLTEVFAYEFAMVAPGLPEIAAAFGTTQVSLVMTLPLLLSALVVPLLAKLGDIHGKKRLLVIGTAVFAVGTVLSALTSSYVLFLVGRGLQSFGLVGPVLAYGLVRDTLPPRWVPIGIGGLGLGFGASAVIGALVGGWLIDTVGYRGVFWFLLAYAVIIGLLVLKFVPESNVRIQQTLDYQGAGLLGLGAGSLMFVDTHPLFAVLGVVLLALFVMVERRKSQPLMSMTLLARPAVWMTLLGAGLVGFIVGGNTVLGSLMLRNPPVPGVADQGLGLSAWEYAINFAMIMGLVGALCGILAGFVCRQLSPRLAFLISIIGWTLATAAMAAGLAENLWAVRGIAVLKGIGLGFFYAATANLVIEAVPARFQGVSASMKYTTEQALGAIAGSIGGAIIAAHIVQISEADGTVYSMPGFHTSYWVLTAAGLAALVIALLMRHGRTPATGGVAPDAASTDTDHHGSSRSLN